MISIFQRTIRDEKVNAIEEFRSGSWIYVESPTQEELSKVAKDFELEEDLLKDGCDPYEVPRMEVEKNAIYIYTRVPVKTNNEITTAPLLIVLGVDFFLTISNDRHSFFRKMISQGNDFFTSQKTAMLIHVFSEILGIYNESLTNIRRQVRVVSDHIEQIKNDDIVKFLNFEGIINDFLSALIPTGTILSDLLSGKAPKDLIKLYEADQDSIEDLFLYTTQTIELCKTSLKSIVNIREAYSIIMTNNLNRAIKLLTALTIIVAIPTLITSMFGMNVKFPFSGESLMVFWVIVVIMLGSVGFTAFFFVKKNWF